MIRETDIYIYTDRCTCVYVYVYALLSMLLFQPLHGLLYSVFFIIFFWFGGQDPNCSIGNLAEYSYGAQAYQHACRHAVRAYVRVCVILGDQG